MDSTSYPRHYDIFTDARGSLYFVSAVWYHKIPLLAWKRSSPYCVLVWKRQEGKLAGIGSWQAKTPMQAERWLHRLAAARNLELVTEDSPEVTMIRRTQQCFFNQEIDRDTEELRELELLDRWGRRLAVFLLAGLCIAIGIWG